MANPPIDIFDPNFFDTNDGSVQKRDLAQFPMLDGAFTAADYADVFGGLTTNKGALMDFASKAGAAGMIDAPEMQSFSRLSQMPNAFTRGMVQWPGLPAATLKKISADNYIVNAIIQQRVADVMRYSQLSSHPWMPGWDIVLKEGAATPSASDLKDIMDARRFTSMCNAEFGWDARKRDEAQLTTWKGFLAASVRDTLRYDGLAWWTDMDNVGRVRAFKALPAANILLTTRDGYEGHPEVFACGVDEAGTVKHRFTRKDLTWVVRNQRTDAEVWGYGYPEIELGVRLIQAFSNAFDMNADIFTRDSIPPGILKLSGMWTQRQTEVISRIWLNLNRGPSKKFAIPAVPLPRDGDISLLDLSNLRDNDVYYKELISMSAGLLCSLFAFPVNRLGYHTSGTNKDSEPNPSTTAATIVDEDDPGLTPLLITIEEAYNSYILQTRWPHLRFVFRGKSPKEDARAYEAKRNASTFDESRALSDKDSIVESAAPEHRELATLMGMAPIDPNLSGIYQSIVAAYLAGKAATQAPATPGNSMESKKDPAASESHGHLSGVRRDSSSESK
jgi:hypothetical protein